MSNITIQYIGTLLSLTGVILNIFKKRSCWIFYFIANWLWIWLYLRIEFYPVVFLMGVYQGLAIWGWIKWGKKKEVPDD